MTYGRGGSAEKDYYEEVRDMAYAMADETLAALFERMKVPKPPQDELRAVFDELAAIADPSAYEAEAAPLRQQLGDDEFTRQYGLAVNRKAPQEATNGT
jgi:hypothetical protein